MIMCQNTVSIFYAEYNKGVTTYRKRTLYNTYINVNRVSQYTKLGTTANHTTKVVLTDIENFIPPNEWLKADTIIKDSKWSLLVSDKDFIVFDEVKEAYTTDTAIKSIKDKYKWMSVKTCDIKYDFNNHIQRVEVLGS